ncbi:MAG: hypothetical protein AAF570_06470 [Bacteroidota bacterium]
MSISSIFTLAIGLLVSISLNSCSSTSTESGYTAGAHHIANQHFMVNAGENEVIQGRDGAIFAIPAGAFMDSMGNTISGPIEIRLKEANRNIDILAGGLVTKTGDDMLASNGMYKIEALQNGVPLVLNPEIGIYANLPTTAKDPNMRLYKGAFNEDKLNWELTDQGEEGLPECDRDKYTRKECRKCRRLLKMADKIKAGKKPTKDEYWVKRHYWQNGVLYFASSGSSKPILSQRQLEECKDYLAQTEKGQALLAEVAKINDQWKDDIGNYYQYKLRSLGWYNIDKLVKDEIQVFAGRVLDEDGNTVPDAKVHLYCKDQDLRVHNMAQAKDGTFSLKFVPNRDFMLYAYVGGKVGKIDFRLNANGQEEAVVRIAQMDPNQVDEFLAELM